MTDISSKLFVWSKYMCMYLWMSYLGNNNYFPGNMHTWNQLQNSLLKLKQKFPDQEYYLYDAYTCMRKKNYNVKHKIGNISYASWKINYMHVYKSYFFSLSFSGIAVRCFSLTDQCYLFCQTTENNNALLLHAWHQNPSVKDNRQALHMFTRSSFSVSPGNGFLSL